MEKNKYLTTIALVLTVLSISAVSAFAATDSTSSSTSTGTDIVSADTASADAERDAKFEEMKAKHEEEMNTVLAGDYDTWYSLMTENGNTPKILDVINKDNFAQFSEAHQLMEESRQILSDLGVEGKAMGMGMEIGMGMGEGFGGGHGGGHMEKKCDRAFDQEDVEDNLDDDVVK
jgi:hypothetical protein